MTCTQVREQLVELWGEVAQLGAEARAHLQQCADCWREAQSLATARKLLGQMTPGSAPEGFCDRVLARIAEVEAVHLSWPERALGWLWPRQHGPAWIRVVAMAAVLMILVGGVAMLHGGLGSGMNSQPPAMIAAGSAGITSVATRDEDLEAMVLRHQSLELMQPLSDDAGVHLISYTY